MAMKILMKRFIILHSINILMSFALCFLFSSNATSAVETKTSVNTASPEGAGTISLPQKESTFAYRIEGRLDPFMPFISDKNESNLDPNEVIESDEQLTGMQLFEPGQLTLVALVNSQDQKFAMVEDVTGKGYIIKEGTKIGRRGVVRSIIPNKVLIEEIAMTRAGKKLTSDIVMVLRKEEKKK
jgi:type IV pilus assembly protein PilP